jgi:NAD-dependent SIR2 family protein deacetylase
MQVLPHNMNLKGNDADVVIYTDGAGISTLHSITTVRANTGKSRLCCTGRAVKHWWR